MRDKSGTTLIELLVVLVIGFIMLFAVGLISDIGRQSEADVQVESSIYRDIAYGFKLIQSRVHSSKIVSSETPGTNAWISDKLIAGNQAFGVYTHTGGHDFVHLPNKSDDNTRRNILSVLPTDTLNAYYSVSGAQVDITLNGMKSDIPFNMTTTINRRL